MFRLPSLCLSLAHCNGDGDTLCMSCQENISLPLPPQIIWSAFISLMFKRILFGRHTSSLCHDQMLYMFIICRYVLTNIVALSIYIAWKDYQNTLREPKIWWWYYKPDGVPLASNNLDISIWAICGYSEKRKIFWLEKNTFCTQSSDQLLQDVMT